VLVEDAARWLGWTSRARARSLVTPLLGHALHLQGTPPDVESARARQGMKPMLRLGSAWYDVATQIKAVTELGLDPRHFILVTDDSHSGTLVNEGHMDRVVQHAIAQGLRPLTAIQMATLNTAEHFGVSKTGVRIVSGHTSRQKLVEIAIP
jgi:adenine deaminase